MPGYSPYGTAPFQAYMQPQQSYSAYQQPPAQLVQAQSAGYPCRPVTSKAQAEMFQIPFDGSSTYFVDTSSGNLYSKTFDFNTGTAPLVTYIREAEQVIQYATIDDINALRAEIDSLKKPGKAAKKNDADE